jgi:hypothetical protein
MDVIAVTSQCQANCYSDQKESTAFCAGGPTRRAVMNRVRRRGRTLLMYLETIQTLYRKFLQWLKGQIAQDVPEADGLCEYDCRKLQCTEEEWATCERRIHKAAGELWPESSRATKTSAKPLPGS